MWVDYETLSKFYDARTGYIAQQMIMQKIGEIWPKVNDEVIVGYGFATPYLDLFRGEAERVISLAPAPQGVGHWPKRKKNLSTIVEESTFPIPDKSVHRMFFIHSFEFCGHPSSLLREAWRILVDGGTLMIITPNRRGPWARRTNTPLGFGHPYTGRQLFSVMEEGCFQPSKPEYCLYTPPLSMFKSLKTARSLESIGSQFSKKFGGVVMIEGHKTVLAPTKATKDIRPSPAFVS